MKSDKRDVVSELGSLSIAFREFVHEASGADLAAAIESEGDDPRSAATEGRALVTQLLAKRGYRAGSGGATCGDVKEALALHEGLSALIQLLRRREGWTEEDLAEKARVEVEEISRIEFDPTYTPNPRTIYQLEQVFRLPNRTLVRLSGAMKGCSREFADEVMRFAVNAKSITKLNRAEKRLLNEFVKFLSTSEPEKGRG